MDFMHWPNYNACHLPFQNVRLLKFQFTTNLCQCLEKTPFVKWKLSNFSHDWFEICGITYEIDFTNFIKVKNYFNVFGEYFHFVVHNYKCYIHTNILQSIVIYIGIYIYIYMILLLKLCSTIMCKNIVKLFHVYMV
jgi:hypothetical protein